MIVKEIFFGMAPAGVIIAQEPFSKEQTWLAIAVTDGGDGGEFAFPWWLVAILGGGIVALVTKKKLEKP